VIFSEAEEFVTFISSLHFLF